MNNRSSWRGYKNPVKEGKPRYYAELRFPGLGSIDRLVSLKGLDFEKPPPFIYFKVATLYNLGENIPKRTGKTRYQFRLTGQYPSEVWEDRRISQVNLVYELYRII